MIRFAKLEDTPEILKLSEEFYNSTLYHETEGSFSKKASEETIISMIEDKISKLALVYELDGKVVGFILGATNTSFFSDSIYAIEVAWYSSKDVSKKVLVKLYNGFEYWAENVVKADYAIGSSPDIESTGKFYERRGYKKQEEVYFRSLR